MGLMMCQGLLGREILEICMVQKDFHHMLTLLEVVTKMAQRTNNGE
jgi:hypothetical protein